MHRSWRTQHLILAGDAAAPLMHLTGMRKTRLPACRNGSLLVPWALRPRCLSVSCRWLLEEASTSTRTNALYALDMAQSYSMKTIVLVTSPFHQWRSYYVFRKVLHERGQTGAVKVCHLCSQCSCIHQRTSIVHARYQHNMACPSASTTHHRIGKNGHCTVPAVVRSSCTMCWSSRLWCCASGCADGSN